MTKLAINLLIFLCLSSCQLQDINKKSKLYKSEDNISNVSNNINFNTIKYILGKKYFIDGVEYTPEENYKYNQIGIATFYNKELHNKKTINNDYNKVTELLGRHKTLPIPSIVKVTNLDNGLSLTIKINDRHKDNSSIIQLSRKSAQLLKFYKNKIAKVRVEILSDPSKQMKVVTQSMSDPDFNGTIKSAPTEDVSISDIILDDSKELDASQESPIEIGFSEITKEKMYLKVYDFESYNIAKDIFLDFDMAYKFTTQNDNGFYTLIIGPLDIKDANNLVLSFISKGYNRTEFYLE